MNESALDTAKRLLNGDGHVPSAEMIAVAHVFAAIAQAEQLGRIADALDLRGEAKAAPRDVSGANDWAANEEYDNHLDNIKRAKEQLDGLRRAAGLE